MPTAHLLIVGLCLTLCSCQSQSTKSGQLDHGQQPSVHAEPRPKPPASIPVQDHYEEEDEEEAHVTPEKQYSQLVKDSKLGVFIAAALGTLTLMGMVYCIYSQFYNKNPYSHTQLHDDTELTLDLSEPSASFFPGCSMTTEREKGPWKQSYGSTLDSPSIISLPPPQSSLPAAMPFPPLSLSHSAPLQTISAQDLEKSFI